MRRQWRRVGKRGRRQPVERRGRGGKQVDDAGEDERGPVRKGAASMRPVVRGVIEPRWAGVILLFLFVLVDVLVLVLVLSDEHDRPVDMYVVVAVVQGVQPRQDGQGGAERAQHETGRGLSATHPAPSLEHIRDLPTVTI